MPVKRFARIVILLINALLLPQILVAQTPVWGSSATCGVPNGGCEGWLIKKAPANSMYVAGYYWGDSLCWGNSTFYNPYNPTSNLQTIVARYSSSGAIMWSRASSNGQSRPLALTTDADGNAIVFGYFTTDTIRFDNNKIMHPEFDTANRLFNKCYYIVKYDSAGNVLWTANGQANISAAGDLLHPAGVCTDENNNIYIATTFSKASMLSGAVTLMNSGPAGTQEIFIIKYSKSGLLMWVKSFGNSSNDYVADMAYAGSGKICVAGYYSSPKTTFGRYNLFTNYSESPYLTCLDTNGSVLWAQSGKGKGKTSCMTVGKSGEIYIGGGFETGMTFGAKGITQSSGYFVARYSADGIPVTVRGIYPTSTTGSCCQMYGMTTDSCGNLWISANLDKISGTKLNDSITLYAPSGSTDPIFFAGFDVGGNTIGYSTLTAGGGDNTGLANTGLEADDGGNLFITGDFQRAESFVAGGDTLRLYNGARANIFVAKYRTDIRCSPLTPTFYTYQLKCYPNPADDYLTITIDGPVTSSDFIKVYDITGRVIIQHPLTSSYYSMPIEDLAAGVYLIKVQIDGSIISTFKQVVLH